MQAGTAQAVGGGNDVAVHPHLALTHERQGHVGERCQVAGSADRTLGGDARRNAGVDERHEGVDEFRAHAGVAAGEARCFQREREANRGVVEQRAGADGVRAHQVGLQPLQLMIGDVSLGELAEAGIDAVGRRAMGDRLLHGRTGGDNRGQGGGVEAEFYGSRSDAAAVGEGEAARNDDERCGHGELCAVPACPKQDSSVASRQCRTGDVANSDMTIALHTI